MSYYFEVQFYIFISQLLTNTSKIQYTHKMKFFINENKYKPMF